MKSQATYYCDYCGVEIAADKKVTILLDSTDLCPQCYARTLKSINNTLAAAGLSERFEKIK